MSKEELMGNGSVEGEDIASVSGGRVAARARRRGWCVGARLTVSADVVRWWCSL